MRYSVAIAFVALGLSACSQSMKEIGRPPSLSQVGYGLAGDEFDAAPVDYKNETPRRSSSLWNSRGGDLFTDKVALDPGDILTVKIAINDKAQFANQSDSKRTVGRGLDLGGTYSIAGASSSGNAEAEINSTSNFKGSGGTVRAETIRLSVAAVVTRVLGNGNLVVRGSQEVRVNSELRVLTIAGIVRPRDIGPYNTISYERIAEARISYGGRGHISHMQRPPYGQQILNHILPF